MKRSKKQQQMHRLCAQHRRAHLHYKLFLPLILLLCLNFGATFATPADLRGADGSSQQKLLSQLLGASPCQAWRPAYLPTSTHNIELLLQGWCRHYWRSMASVNDHEDYLGDYSPSANVDQGVAGPLPSPIHVHTMIGNKRKLLQDYSPMANTNPGPTARR